MRDICGANHRLVDEYNTSNIPLNLYFVFADHDFSPARFSEKSHAKTAKTRKSQGGGCGHELHSLGENLLRDGRRTTGRG